MLFEALGFFVLLEFDMVIYQSALSERQRIELSTTKRFLPIKERKAALTSKKFYTNCALY